MENKTEQRTIPMTTTTTTMTSEATGGPRCAQLLHLPPVALILIETASLPSFGSFATIVVRRDIFAFRLKDRRDKRWKPYYIQVDSEAAPM